MFFSSLLGPVLATGPSCFWRPALPRWSACAAFCILAWAGGLEIGPARAGEYRDPEGRFTIMLSDGFVEVDRSILEARLAAVRHGGPGVPLYRAAFDRGVEPRLSYPYALLEVVPIPGAAWTTADLELVLRQTSTEEAARRTAAAFDRLGLGNLLRDPRVTFLQWEAERQAGAYRIRTQAQGTEVHGEGRIYFYRRGYIALWFYYLAGTPYAEVAGRFTGALTVLPEHRAPAPDRSVRSGAILVVGVGVIVVGFCVWAGVRRRRAKGDGSSGGRHE